MSSKLIRAYIGVGSNLDNPSRQVRRALSALDSLAGTCCVGQSSLYGSKPVGPRDQPDYVNAVAAVDTLLSPHDLLRELQVLEQQQGRVRTAERWGPRTLDLDLLVYGGKQIDDAHLTVPHPRLPERPFVLYPLHEIAPGLIVPGMGALNSLVNACPRAGLYSLSAHP